MEANKHLNQGGIVSRSVCGNVAQFISVVARENRKTQIGGICSNKLLSVPICVMQPSGGLLPRMAFRAVFITDLAKQNAERIDAG